MLDILAQAAPEATSTANGTIISAVITGSCMIVAALVSVWSAQRRARDAAQMSAPAHRPDQGEPRILIAIRIAFIALDVLISLGCLWGLWLMISSHGPLTTRSAALIVCFGSLMVISSLRRIP